MAFQKQLSLIAPEIACKLTIEYRLMVVNHIFGFNLTARDPTAVTVHVSDNSSVQVSHHDKDLDYRWISSAKWITSAVTGDLDADGTAGLSDAKTARPERQVSS